MKPTTFGINDVSDSDAEGRAAILACTITDLTAIIRSPGKQIPG
jgi:hypothetical protein